MASDIARLNDFGQSPWYDNLARSLLTDGGLASLVKDDGIRGVTSNPTIFEKAMGTGDVYDAGLRECAAKGLSIEESYWELVVEDVGHAADILRPVYDTTAGADGFVSIEVSPDLAHDTAGTINQAKELFARLDRPNVMIKIPATIEGFAAITATIAAGINVNITLIFRPGSPRRRDRRLLRRPRAARRCRWRPGEGVIGCVVLRQPRRHGNRSTPARKGTLRGKAAVANAKLAYKLFEERFAGDRWDALAAKGARLQRPLWASTSTKNPDYSPTLYIDELIGRTPSTRWRLRRSMPCTLGTPTWQPTRSSATSTPRSRSSTISLVRASTLTM